MSIWYDIKDKEDLSLSLDGKDLHVNFDGDDNGNIYVAIPLELIESVINKNKKGHERIKGNIRE